jgi:hypothetical protein
VILRTVLALVAVAVAPVAADTVHMIDGGVTTGFTVTGLEPGRVQLDGAADDPIWLDLDRVREITFSRDVTISSGSASLRLFTAAGSIIEGELAPATEDATDGVTIQSRLFAPTTLGLDAVAAIHFLATTATPPPGFDELRREGSRLEDLVFLRADEGWVRLEGLVEEIRASSLALSWEGATRTIPIERIGGVVLAAGGARAASTGIQCRVHFAGGSELVGVPQSYDGELLVLDLGGGALIRLRAGAVERITVHSGRLRYLSDLEPAAVRETSFWSTGWRWQRDRAVTGAPMRLGRVTWQKGIGVHAGTAIDWELDGQATTFAATIGLDSSAHELGSVTFRVLLDGTPVLARAMRAGDPPASVSIALEEASLLTLAVDWGSDELDVGDHANWADARLLAE